MKKVSETTTLSKEATMTKFIVRLNGVSKVYELEKFNNRTVFKLLRDEKFLPKESTGKTSADVDANGLMIVSFKDIEVTIEICEDEVEGEVYLVASEEAQAAASGDNYGVTSAFNMVTNKALYFSDFSNKNEDGDVSIVGARGYDMADVKEEKDEERMQNKINLVRAKKFLTKKGIDWSTLNEEIIVLYASQLTDLAETGWAIRSRDLGTSVTVTVQRKTKNGYWMNVKLPIYKEQWDAKKKAFVKKKVGEKLASYTYDIADIFELNDRGEPVAFKMVENSLEEAELLHVMMAKKGHKAVDTYSYRDPETMEIVNVVQDQRFVIKSSVLAAGVSIGKIRLESTVAPFFHKVEGEIEVDFIRTENDMWQEKTVAVGDTFQTGFVNVPKGTEMILPYLANAKIVKGFTYYGNDNAVDMLNGCVIIPSTDDESNGDAAEAEFDEGILYGTSMSTQAMMSDDIVDQDIAARYNEEKRSRRAAEKAAVRDMSKEDINKLHAEEMLLTAMGKIVVELAPKTWAAEKDAELMALVIKEIESYKDKAVLLNEAMIALKRVDGKGFAYSAYRIVSAMAREAVAQQTLEENVAEHIIKNIEHINNGTLTIDRMNDQQIVEVYTTAKSKKNPYRLNDKDIAKAFRVRAAQVTGFKY